MPATCAPSSCARSARGRCAVALALLLLAPVAAGAGEWKVWPFFRWAAAPSHGLTRWTALGPLIEYSGTLDGWSLHVRPLLALERRTNTDDLRADVLFPLGRLWSRPGEMSFRFLLFTAQHRSATAADVATSVGDETRLGLYPFAFYRRSPDGVVSGGVLPFYLDLRDVLGYERVTTILFPAYLSLQEPTVTHDFFAFPFVSTLGGREGRGWRLWPFYGDTAIGDRDHTRFVGWPFHIERERTLDDGGREIQRISPGMSTSDRPGVHVRSYGLLAYTHTIDETAGSESIGSPWPFVARERPLGETAWRSWRFAPFYGRADRDGFSSRFYAWPLYRWRRSETADSTFERIDVLLLLWRWQREHLPSGRTQTLHTLFPLWRAEIDDARHHGQTPALLDAILPTNRGLLDEWAPLYGLLRWDTSIEGTTDLNLLWGLVTREHGGWRGPVYFALGGDGG